MSEVTAFKFPNESFSGVDMVATAHIRDFSDPNKSLVVELGSIQTISYSIHMDRKPIRSIGNINVKDYVLGPRTIAGSLIFAVFNKHFAYKIFDSIDASVKPTYAYLVDELPPFDITISMSNEYGYKARLVIYGIRLVNEGQVMSVNDVYTENTYQFVATDLEYLTDNDGYSSYTAAHGYKMIGTQKAEKDEIINADKIKAGIAMNNVKNTEKAPVLSVKTRPALEAEKSGMAIFNLSPTQSTGIISISGGKIDDKNPLIVDVAHFPNQTIYVDLPPGKYHAIYKDSLKDIKSNTVWFSLAEYIYWKPEEGIAPLIEQVTDTKIAVYSNLTEHSHIKIAQVIEGKDPVFTLIPLNGRRAVISELIAETKYILATCNAYDTSSSKTVEVKTLASYDKPYKDLKEYLYLNSEKFTTSPLADYYSVIDEAEIVAQKLSLYSTIADAIAIIKNNNQMKMTTMKVSDFRTLDEYNREAERLVKKDAICFEIIMASVNITNDRYYAINRKTFSLVPPVPETLDNTNSVILTSTNTTALEFYRQYQQVSQFISKIGSNLMEMHPSGKLACRFMGRPGWKHYVHAMNELHQRSPRFEFYVMTDAERTNRVKKIAEQQEFINEILIDARTRVGYKPNSAMLTDNQTQRAVIKNAKDIDVPLLPAPVVIESNESMISLNVDYRDLIGEYDNEYLVILSEADNALYDIPRYKLRINKDTVEARFTADDHGIKPNKIYVTWIENKNGTQVSKCTTAYSYKEDRDADTHEEDNIHIYELSKYIERFEAALSNKIAIEYEVKYAIDNLKDDTTVNENNFYSRLIQNIMTLRPKLSNESAVIKSIFQARHDIDFVVSEDFFGDAIVYKNRTIKLPALQDEYMVSAYFVKTENEEASVEIKTYKSEPGKGLTINIDDGMYVSLHAIADDIFTKSGLIFVNVLSDTASNYKISMEVSR